MSWGKVKLSSFLKPREYRFKPHAEEIKYLRRVEKINFDGKIFLSNSPSNTDMILIKKGDLLISGINVHKGAIAIYEGKEDVAATIHYSNYEYDPNQIDIEFLKIFLKSPEFLQAIKEQVPGGIKTEIKPKHLLPLQVVIPDIAEQRIIVKNYQSFQVLHSSLIYEIENQNNLVTQLRQAFLREAMQGKLVPQNPTDEPALILLERIKAEKEKLIAEGKIKKEKLLPPIKPEEIPFEIPSTWVWCRLGEILLFGPTNGLSLKPAQNSKGIKCLTLTATTSGIFKKDYYKIVDLEISQDSELWLSPNDILIQRGNSIDYVGIAAIYNGVLNDYIYPDLMMKIKAHHYINPYYLYNALISPLVRNYFRDNAFGAQKSMPKINQTTVIKTLIPLPPLAGQQRIVSKLNQLMQVCDQLEQNINTTKEQTNLLLQTVLREALEPRRELTSNATPLKSAKSVCF